MIRETSIENREYLIDHHFRVSFENGSAWRCDCREFDAVGACRHTREAAGMRAAQARILEHVTSGTSGLRHHIPRTLRTGSVR